MYGVSQELAEMGNGPPHDQLFVKSGSKLRMYRSRSGCFGMAVVDLGMSDATAQVLVKQCLQQMTISSL